MDFQNFLSSQDSLKEIADLQPVTIETWKELTHSEDLKKSEKLLEKHFNGETDIYECEVRMKRKNGDWIWVLDRGRVMEWDKERNPARMVGTHQDITQRKQEEKKLHEERDKLKRLHDAVDELQRQDTEDEVVETAVEVTEKMLDFELCAIDILEGDYLVPKANSAGLDPEETTAFKIGEGIGGKTVQKGETIWGNDVREHPDAKPTKGE